MLLTIQILRGRPLHAGFRGTEKGARSPAPETGGRAAQRHGGAGLRDGGAPAQPFRRAHLLSHWAENPGTA